jgi:hypothetical protein
MKSKYLTWIAIATSLVTVVVVAVFFVGGFNKTEAQTFFPKDSKGAVWNRKEIPIQTFNSKLSLELPNSLAKEDYVVGIKPIEKGQKEKVFAGLITWEETDNKNLKKMGFRKIASIEDYADKFNSLGEKLSLSDDRTNGTLIIYLELPLGTELNLQQGGNQTLTISEKESFVVFDGIKSSAQIEGPSTLIRELEIKHMQKVTKENNINFRVNEGVK